MKRLLYENSPKMHSTNEHGPLRHHRPMPRPQPSGECWGGSLGLDGSVAGRMAATMDTRLRRFQLELSSGQREARIRSSHVDPPTPTTKTGAPHISTPAFVSLLFLPPRSPFLTFLPSSGHRTTQAWIPPWPPIPPKSNPRVASLKAATPPTMTPPTPSSSSSSR